MVKRIFSSESLFHKRVRKFRSCKRAYFSLWILMTLYIVSFFSPLLVNDKALLVRYENQYYFPAFSDLFGSFFSVHYDCTQFGQTEIFGKKAYGPPHYRELQKQYQTAMTGNRVWMPLYPYNPNENLMTELKQHPPTHCDSKHILGTDNRGRDVFARLVYGFRISLSFALVITLFSHVLGIIIGALLGYYGGIIDILGQRIIEMFTAIPILYMSMILVSFMKPSFILLCLILIFLEGWIHLTFYIRGEFYREKAKEYVLAAIGIGAGDFQVMFKHILPNSLTPVITFTPFAIVSYITVLVALDFLGLGLPPPTPSWGELLNQGVADLRHWHLIVFPLAALFLTLMLVTLIGEGIRDAFDPKPFSRLR
ncbi:MAG: ABC transporter permease subunit [Candidatus Aureabacteria bacterium]|nr:ABC transporter permease subunit [Candidatus Auribacterota bacterium]